MFAYFSSQNSANLNLKTVILENGDNVINDPDILSLLIPVQCKLHITKCLQDNDMYVLHKNARGSQYPYIRILKQKNSFLESQKSH